MVSSSSFLVLRLTATLACLIGPAYGHGYLAVPVSRNLLHNTDYCPQCLNAGGPGTVGSGGETWPNGKHGICGDPYNAARKHEYGGVSATGNITATYTDGQEVEFTVVITAAHMGRYGFRICLIKDPLLEKTELTDECLDEHILVQSDDAANQSPGDRWWYHTPNTAGTRLMKYKLPAGLTCDGVTTRCVLQWYYGTGNSCTMPGTPSEYASAELAVCGPSSSTYPEEFWNCADIAIATGSTSPSPAAVPPPSPTATSPPSPRASPPPLPQADPSPSPSPASLKSPPPPPRKLLSPPPPSIPSGSPCAAKDGDCTCSGKPDGLYPDVGGGCKGFFYCRTLSSGVQAAYTACPAGTLYSTLHNYCDWENNVECAASSPSLQPSPSPSPSIPPPKVPSPSPVSPSPSPSSTCAAKDGACACAGKSEGWYPDVGGRCKGFFYCRPLATGMQTSYTACPSGTLYSTLQNYCDWEQNVTCS